MKILQLDPSRAIAANERNIHISTRDMNDYFARSLDIRGLV